MKDVVTLQFNGMQYTIWKKEFDKVIPENLKTITEYDINNKREGLTDKTRGNQIQFILALAKHFQKPFKDLTKKDLNDYIDTLQISNASKGYYAYETAKSYNCSWTIPPYL